MESVQERMVNQAQAATALPPGFAGLAQQMQELMRPIVETVRKMMESIREVVRDFIEHVIKPIVYALSWWRPIYYIPTPRSHLHVHEADSGGFLATETDPYGFFIIGGRKITRLHSKTSSCGRLLKALLLSRAEIVSYEEIREVIGASDRKIVFRDLKRQLRRESLELKYQLVPAQGIAMLGIAKLQ